MIYISNKYIILNNTIRTYDGEILLEKFENMRKCKLI